MSSLLLHQTIVMAKPSSCKKNSSKNKHASTSKDPKTPKKRGRKAAPPIVRSTLSTVCKFVLHIHHDFHVVSLVC